MAQAPADTSSRPAGKHVTLPLETGPAGATVAPSSAGPPRPKVIHLEVDPISKNLQSSHRKGDEEDEEDEEEFDEEEEEEGEEEVSDESEGGEGDEDGDEEEEEQAHAVTQPVSLHMFPEGLRDRRRPSVH